MHIRVSPVQSALLVLLVLAGGAQVHLQSPIKLDPLLQQRLSRLTEQSDVVITAPDAHALELVALLVHDVGGAPGRRLPLING